MHTGRIDYAIEMTCGLIDSDTCTYTCYKIHNNSHTTKDVHICRSRSTFKLLSVFDIHIHNIYFSIAGSTHNPNQIC